MYRGRYQGGIQQIEGLENWLDIFGVVLRDIEKNPRKRSIEVIGVERYQEILRQYQEGIEMQKNMNFQERKDMEKMQT